MASLHGYLEEKLPPAVQERLKAGAFESLCIHLRDRSDEVQNMDLMTVSGFCRNCLAKWLVLEARHVADALLSESQDQAAGLEKTILSLNALGYDEAAEYVYGMQYKDWKNLHSRPASTEAMERFNASKGIWAKHNKDMLSKRAHFTHEETTVGTSTETLKSAVPPMSSNVCCQDVDTTTQQSVIPPSNETQQAASLHQLIQVYPDQPSISLSVGILTVSDRAAAGEYHGGDLSGPAVQEALHKVLQNYSGRVELTSLHMSIVPDEAPAITSKIKEWCDEFQLSMVLTTGGTGFGPRDITPEATAAILEREADGLMSFCALQCSRLQPLASLSRGKAGICRTTFILNLPGNPQAAAEIVPFAFPLALNALVDLSGTV